MSDPWSWLDSQLESLEEAGLRRELRRRESPPVAGKIQVNGQQYLNFSSNDYLGLAADDRVVDTVKRFAGYHGWGSGASSLVSGRGSLHAELERRLADHEGTEAALLFPTGYSTNLGVLSALLDPESIVFSDEKNHASIIDGIRLSRAQCEIYRHGDDADLKTRLNHHSKVSRKFIVTDSLFSMDGDLAPLSQIIHLASEHDALVIIDEAHATGVFGAKGAGVHEHLHLDSKRLLIIGTMSKALGSLGGFVAGPQNVVEWIWNRARSYIFSTAAPDVACAASMTSLDLVHQHPEWGSELLETAQRFRSRLMELGWDVGQSCSQIVPIYMGEPDHAVSLSQQLMKHGYLVPAIRPPAVPNRQALLRVSLCRNHRDEDLDAFLETLGPAHERLIKQS